MEQFLSLPKNEIIKTELEASKSRFLGFARHIETEQQAQEFLDDLRKEYKDARHICFAYKLLNTSRASDDGEPSGTAGKPMLDIIDKLELYNVIVVIVRYFGGVKLGAGRLLRTYATSASDTLKQKQVLWEKCLEKELILNFLEYQTLQKQLNKIKIKVLETDFSDNVKVKISVSASENFSLGKEISSKEIWEHF